MFLFDAVFVDGAIWVANGKRGQSTRLHSGKMYSFSPFSALGRACHITLQFHVLTLLQKQRNQLRWLCWVLKHWQRLNTDPTAPKVSDWQVTGPECISHFSSSTDTTNQSVSQWLQGCQYKQCVYWFARFLQVRSIHWSHWDFLLHSITFACYFLNIFFLYSPSKRIRKEMILNAQQSRVSQRTELIHLRITNKDGGI